MKKEFYSNGKLLITGEYLVLDGAMAFALPTKFGQNLIIESGSNKEIKWKSYDSNGSVWFEDRFLFSEISNTEKLEKTNSERDTLLEILHEAFKLNPDFIKKSEGFLVTTHLTFPRFWGLGTSSTLINNVAQWSQVDAFELLQNSFGGSGYDIACAQNKSPILYRLENGKPIVEKINFTPEFTQNIYFVYLEKKQSSKEAIASYYNNKPKNLEKIISENEEITLMIIGAKTTETFSLAIEKHESELSKILKMQTVKEYLFPDFDGVIKSLGAWGGDFVMAISNENPTDYFLEKGYETVIPYEEMIL